MKQRRLVIAVGILVVLLLFSAAPTFADQVPANLAQFVEHMGFLGYSVGRVTDSSVRLTHTQHLDVTISRFRGGILFWSYFFAKDAQASANPGFLQLINTMNEDAATSRYYRDSDGDLAVESWYAGEYNRAQFGVFVDVWQSDWTSALSKNRSELVRYVR